MGISPEAKKLLESLVSGEIEIRHNDSLVQGLPDYADQRHRELLARGFIEPRILRVPERSSSLDVYLATPKGCEYLESLSFAFRVKKWSGRLLWILLGAMMTILAGKILALWMP